MTSPVSTLNLTPVPCVAVEMTPSSPYVEIEPRLCMARPYIAKILLEVDEGDARFCNDVAFFNVDLGTWSEKKKSGSVALIDGERVFYQVETHTQ